MHKHINLQLLSQAFCLYTSFRNTIWNGYQHINQLDLKFGIKSLCNHPAFKTEGDRTIIMISINWKKKQVNVNSYPKDSKNLLGPTKDRAKNTLALWSFQLFLLLVARDFQIFSPVDFQAFNFLQFSGTSIMTYIDEMVIATLPDRNFTIT